MSNTIRLQKTGNGNCVYMHKGKKLYINEGEYEDGGVVTPGFKPLIINGEIETIGTNTKFDKIEGSTKVGVTINDTNYQLYTKQKGLINLPIENRVVLLTCKITGELNNKPTPPLWSWRWRCHKGKYCIPTQKEGTSYDECKETCGLTEDDNVNYILSIISIVLISLVLLIFVFIVMFSNDINNGTTSFFKNLLVILFITAVILLSVIAYRLSN